LISAISHAHAEKQKENEGAGESVWQVCASITVVSVVV